MLCSVAAASRAVQSARAGDVIEIKSMIKPPPLVLLVMEVRPFNVAVQLMPKELNVTLHAWMLASIPCPWHPQAWHPADARMLACHTMIMPVRPRPCASCAAKSQTGTRPRKSWASQTSCDHSWSLTRTTYRTA